MGVSNDYLNAIANHGASIVKYIGHVDDTGVELQGGDYARKAVTWTEAPTGGTAGLRPLRLNGSRCVPGLTLYHKNYERGGQDAKR